jgi:membrane protease YdiL (CAAX protease family)
MRSDATADRAGALICSIGLLVAALSLVLAAIAGPPYLGLSGINGWMIVLAAGLLAALIAIPFVLEARLRGSYSDSDARWDRAIPIWGGIALIVTVVGALIGASGDFAGDSLAGSAGLLAAGAGGLVLIAVATALLSG